MKKTIKALLNKAPYVRDLHEQVKLQGAFPAGHYYSPIPTEQDVRAYIESRGPPSERLPGIELNEEGQYKLLRRYVEFYKDIPYPEKQTSGRRYYYDNDWFSYSDAIFLYCFLREHKPKKIIEIGSGFSSAAMLDAADTLPEWSPQLVFVEPYPERLLSLMKENDKTSVTLIDSKIQDVSLDTLLALESGDLLFVDSSHVVKCGSDLQLLLFEVLPRLQSGVYVHFHDVFYPFDYPSEWLEAGRFWNENYFLRAFLSYNSAWSICFFNTYVNARFDELIKKKMPLCTKNTGGSLYIQRG